MVPSSTAGGQQIYSQSSPFQQGHTGKSFRSNLWHLHFCLSEPELEPHFHLLCLCLSSSVVHVPGVNDIQPSGSSSQNLAQISRQLNPGQVAWSGNRPPFSGQVRRTGGWGQRDRQQSGNCNKTHTFLCIFLRQCGTTQDGGMYCYFLLTPSACHRPTHAHRHTGAYRDRLR